MGREYLSIWSKSTAAATGSNAFSLQATYILSANGREERKKEALYWDRWARNWRHALVPPATRVVFSADPQRVMTCTGACLLPTLVAVFPKPLERGFQTIFWKPERILEVSLPRFFPIYFSQQAEKLGPLMTDARLSHSQRCTGLWDPVPPSLRMRPSAGVQRWLAIRHGPGSPREKGMGDPQKLVETSCVVRLAEEVTLRSGHLSTKKEKQEGEGVGWKGCWHAGWHVTLGSDWYFHSLSQYRVSISSRLFNICLSQVIIHSMISLAWTAQSE